MAKKRKNYQRTTPEEDAQRDEHYRMAQERIAYHEAKALEQEQAQAQAQAQAQTRPQS